MKCFTCRPKNHGIFGTVNKLTYFLLFFSVLFCSCRQDDITVPKPKGYFRIQFPEKRYQSFDENAHFSFVYPTYSSVTADGSRDAKQDWYNLQFPQINGRLHLTYYPIHSVIEFDKMVEDARKLAFEHTVKASAIDQQRIYYPDHRVYGIYYEIDGNTASSVQFFLTDSTKHYFRGALYFNERPQYDSISPVIHFIKKDIDKLIRSFKWKN